MLSLANRTWLPSIVAAVCLCLTPFVIFVRYQGYSLQRIEILTGQDADGNPVTAPFEATATMQNSPGKKRKGKSAVNSKNSGSESETDNSTLF